MVKRFLILFIFVVMSFISISSEVLASKIISTDPNVDSCFVKFDDYVNAINYNVDLRKCLNDELSVSHNAWSCNLFTNDDFNAPKKDIDACANEFVDSVCQEIFNRKSDSRRQDLFVQRCEEQRTGYINVYIAQNTLQTSSGEPVLPTPTATPPFTPTPTLRPDSAYRNDACLQRLQNGDFAGQGNNCVDVVSNLIDCYGEIPEGNRIWSCQATNNSEFVVNETICAESFVGKIRSDFLGLENKCNISQKEFDIATLNDLLKRTDGIITPLTLENLYKDKLIKRQPDTVVKEPGVIDEQYLRSIDRTETDDELLKEAYDSLTCGFASAEGKNACCIGVISEIDPNLSNNDEVVEDVDCTGPLSLLGVCEAPDLNQMAKNKFTEYLEENSVTSGLNALIDETGAIPPCFIGTPSNKDDLPNCVCNVSGPAEICSRYIKVEKDPLIHGQCVSCMEKNGGINKNFYSALGCIDTSFDGIITAVFSLGLGIAGTTALFCIIYAAFIMQSSQNNPEKIQKAQETITSCITGLILIIFSVFVLRVIGVDLLRIPGFATTTTSPQITCNPGQIQCIGTTICVDSQDQCPQE